MLFDNSTHTLDLFCLMQFIKDNGVFVKSLIEDALKKLRKHFLALLTMHFQSYINNTVTFIDCHIRYKSYDAWGVAGYPR